MGSRSQPAYVEPRFGMSRDLVLMLAYLAFRRVRHFQPSLEARAVQNAHRARALARRDQRLQITGRVTNSADLEISLSETNPTNRSASPFLLFLLATRSHLPLAMMPRRC